MASLQRSNPIHVHGAALALALISSVPMPSGPTDALKSVAWVSYGLVEETIKGSGILESLKQRGENYVGAAALIIYILVTVYMTVRMSVRLAVASSTIPDNQSGKVSLFGYMAVMSFTVASLNMILVLIDFYLKWTRDPVVRLKLLATSPGTAAQIWKWISTSTIFVDFAKALYRTNGEYWWSAQGLLATMLSSTYMSAVGQLYEIDYLAEYLVLGQLLPVSFAQNLFCVALFLKRVKKDISLKSSKASGILPEPVAWATLVGFRVFTAYLPVLMSKAEEPLLVIGGLRGLLFINYFVSFNSGAVLQAAIPWAMLYKIGFSISPASISVSSLDALLHSIGMNFASNVLGMDFVIWYVSMVLWGVSEYF